VNINHAFTFSQRKEKRKHTFITDLNPANTSLDRPVLPSPFVLFVFFLEKIDQFCGRSIKEPASRVPDVQGKKIVCLLKPPNDAMLTLQSILCSTKCSTQTRCRFVQYAGPYSALKKQGRSGSVLYKMVEHGMPPDQPRSLKRKKKIRFSTFNYKNKRYRSSNCQNNLTL